MIKTSPVGELSEIEVLKKQIEELTKLVMASQQPSDIKPKKERPVRLARQEKTKDISPNHYVNVMNLVNNPLNLSTQPRGKGKSFRFEKFGDIKRLFYSELLDVIGNHPNFFEKGYFYVLDSDVIEMNNYVDLYAKLLTKEMMQSIIDNGPSALELFERAGQGQRDIVIEFLVDKVATNQPIDFNLIANINRIGKIDIQKMANDKIEAQKLIENK